MLELRDVQAGYGQAAVLHGLSFGVADGEVVVLLGRNGMGKTSTMRAVMGWEEPQVTGGSITFAGLQLRGAPPHKVASAGIGYVPQGRLVFPSLNVEEHLLVGADVKARRGAKGAWTLERVYELFPKLGQRRTQRAATLSGGEQQMLVIGRALMTNPRLLLLDEPSEGLAPLIVRQVGETVAELRRDGMSILVAEQDVRFAIGLADRVVVLEGGRVVAEGTPEEIDADDELKRRHLGVESAASVASRTAGEPSPNGQVKGGSVTVGIERGPRRRPAGDRVPAEQVTRVRTLLGGHPWSHRLSSNGWSPTESEPHTIVEPATGRVLGEVAVAGPAETAEAVGSAVEAQRAWAATPADERCEILLSAARLLEQNGEEIGDWLVREAGMTRACARHHLAEAGREVRAAAVLAIQPTGSLLPSSGDGEQVSQRRVAAGVVGVVTPYSAPLVLAARAVGAALAVGDAVLLKPDVRTAVSGGIVLARILDEAGLPRGVLHVLPAGAATAQAIVMDARVASVWFAGARRAGQHVAAVAGQHLTPVALHLGGPNAWIVLDDADVAVAAEQGARSSFAHQGQSCVAAGRHLVHRAVADEYVTRVAAHAAALRQGDPYLDDEMDVGPLIDVSHARRTVEIIDASRAAGARHRVGGTRAGAFYPPTVLVDVRPGMPAFDRELLAPVAAVATFETEEELLELATHGHPGPSAVVHTTDPSRARGLADHLRVERFTVGAVPADDGGDVSLFTRMRRVTESA